MTQAPSGPEILTIVLNYKTAEMTRDAVSAAITAMEGLAGRIIVVDNDSGDGSFETLSTAATQPGWERVSVIASGRNGGFGAGNNFGILTGLNEAVTGHPRPDYVYILNSDAFPAPDAIRILRDHLEATPKAGFAGSYIHGPDGDWHCTIFRFPSVASEFEGAARTGPITRLLRNAVIPQPLPEGPKAVDWLAGASMMMRVTTLEEIGLFDEAFFLYFEETDLCRRAHNAGWQVWYLPESQVTHIGSVSTGMKTWRRKPAYWFDSRRHYFVQNHGAVYAALATIAHLSGGLIWQIRKLIQRKPQQDPDHFLADLARHDLRALWAALRRPRPRGASRDIPRL